MVRLQKLRKHLHHIEKKLLDRSSLIFSQVTTGDSAFVKSSSCSDLTLYLSQLIELSKLKQCCCSTTGEKLSWSFTGTGSHDDVGFGKGKYYSVNVPLKDGITDKPFIEIFSRLVQYNQTFHQRAIKIYCKKLAEVTRFYSLPRRSRF